MSMSSTHTHTHLHLACIAFIGALFNSALRCFHGILTLTLLPSARIEPFTHSLTKDEFVYCFVCFRSSLFFNPLPLATYDSGGRGRMKHDTRFVYYSFSFYGQIGRCVYCFQLAVPFFPFLCLIMFVFLGGSYCYHCGRIGLQE
jgi:hypothetical protein